MRTRTDETTYRQETLLEAIGGGARVKDALAAQHLPHWQPSSWGRTRWFRAAWREARNQARRERQFVFLSLIADGLPHREASKLAGIADGTPRRWRRFDRDFGVLYDVLIAARRLAIG